MANRRYFLKVLGATAAGALVGCDEDGGVEEAKGPVSAGKVSDYPVGSLKALGDQPLAVGHDEGGLYAMSTVCPHERCDMRKDGSVSERGLSCSCHGSEFDRNGAVLRSPARSSLRHYRLTVTEGAITVFGGEDVAATERVAV